MATWESTLRTTRRFSVNEETGKAIDSGDDPKWLGLFDAFMEIRLKDGDIVNVIPVYRIPLFSRHGF